MGQTARTLPASPLDPFEIKILRLIQSDANVSVAEIADQVGLSPSPTWRRLDRLEKEGFVRRKVALLDAAKLGLNVQIFAFIKLDANGRGRLDEFVRTVTDEDRVLECFAVMGAFDYMIRVVADDLPAYHDFVLTVLSTIPGILNINSFAVLSELKSTTALPV